MADQSLDFAQTGSYDPKGKEEGGCLCGAIASEFAQGGHDFSASLPL